MKHLFACTVLLGVGSALASPATISTQSIIVNPVDAPLNVNVWVNKDPNGGSNPVYRAGERLEVSVATSADAYVYLFDVNAAGRITLISPNGYEDSNFVSAGVVRRFPSSTSAYTFNVQGPAGQDKVLALASTTELDLNDIADFAGSQGFATVRIQGQQQLAQALSDVVDPLDPEDWVTDTAFFQVSTGLPRHTTPLPPIPADPDAPGAQPPVSEAPTSAPQAGIQPGERQSGSVDAAIAAAWDRTRGPDTLGDASTYVQRWGTGSLQKFSGVAAYGDGVILHADGSSRAYAVHGMLLKRYLALAQAESGGNRPPSRLGWAAGDEKVIPRNPFGTSGLYGFFQKGALYGTERYGTYWLNGDLLKKYQGLGGSGSFLGFPRRDPYTYQGHLAADFEGGTIRWNRSGYTVIRR